MSFTAPLDGNLKTYALPLTPIAHTLDHEKVRIGQIAHVIARHKGLLAAADVKIVRIERYLKDPGRTRITWGSPLPLQSDYIRNIERMADWRDRRRRKLDRGRGPATVTVASEETSAAPWYAKVIVPAGATNFQDYLKQAIDMLPPEGGRIVIYEGIYFYDNELIIEKDNVAIMGMGEATQLIMHPEPHFEYTQATIISFDGKVGIAITDLVIDGNKDNYAHPWELWSTAIAASSHWVQNNGGWDTIPSRNTTLRNLIIKNFFAMGISVNHCEDAIIENCRISNCNYGIYLYADTGETGNFTVINNSCFENDSNGIGLEACERMNVEGNRCRGNGGSGILIERLTNCTINNNTCEENNMGISGTKSYGSAINNNVCNNHELHGISITVSDHNNINGNVSNDNGTSGGGYTGIAIHGTKNSIQTNVCHGNPGCGIWIRDGANYTLVTNNDLADNGGGGVTNEGSNTKVDPGNRS